MPSLTDSARARRQPGGLLQRVTAFAAALLCILCITCLTPPAAAEPDKTKPDAKQADKKPDRPKHDGLSEDEVEKRLKVLAEVSPALAERFKHVSETNPRYARRMARHLMPRLGHMIKLKESDPKEYELRKNEMAGGYQLLQQMRTIRDAQKDGGKVDEQEYIKLRRFMAHHMETRLKIRELEIVKMQDRIDAIREHIQRERDQRDKVIDDRIKEMRDGKFRMRSDDSA